MSTSPPSASDTDADELARRNRVLIDYSQAALWVFDVDAFRMLDANGNTAALVKMPLEEFIGASPLDFSPPLQPGGLTTAEHAARVIGRALGGETVVAPWTFRATDGTLLPCEIRAALVPQAGRRLICGSTIDLTERARVDAELVYRQRLETLIARLSSRIIRLDGDQLDAGIEQALAEIGAFAKVDRVYVYAFGDEGRTISCTHEWCATGIFSTKVRMQNLPSTAYRWSLDRVRMGKFVHVPRATDLPPEAASERSECAALAVRSFLMVPMGDDTQVTGMVGFNSVRDEVNWSADEIDLLRIFGEMLLGALQRRRDNATLRQQAEELRRSNAELTRSNAELQQFAYIASHDLQEPLRTISNFTQLLEKRYRGRLDEDADTYIGFLQEAARRMHAMVAGILEYSRAGSQTQPFRRCEMNKALRLALANLDASIRELKAEVTHGELPPVLGDGAQLVQVLQNLIGNGIKFHGDQPPRVHIEAQMAPVAGEGWMFSVRDNGIGISPAHAAQLFQLFRRLHTQDHYPGSGIGLALCKTIVERHRGRIWVEANPGRGCTFYFTLPSGGAAPPAAAGQAAG